MLNIYMMYGGMGTVSGQRLITMGYNPASVGRVWKINHRKISNAHRRPPSAVRGCIE